MSTCLLPSNETVNKSTLICFVLASFVVSASTMVKISKELRLTNDNAKDTVSRALVRTNDGPPRVSQERLSAIRAKSRAKKKAKKKRSQEAERRKQAKRDTRKAAAFAAKAERKRRRRASLAENLTRLSTCPNGIDKQRIARDRYKKRH